MKPRSPLYLSPFDFDGFPVSAQLIITAGSLLGSLLIFICLLPLRTVTQPLSRKDSICANFSQVFVFSLQLTPGHQTFI